MTGTRTCIRCGTQSALTSQFCHVCGLLLVPFAPTYISPELSGQTPSVRPVGVSLLAAAEIVIGIIGLYVLRDFAYSADWSFTNDEWFSGMVDGAFAVSYVVLACAAFVLATRLWAMQARAWLPSVILSASAICLIVVGDSQWGVTTLDVIGVIAHAGILVYLNLGEVRRLFGRRPLGAQ